MQQGIRSRTSASDLALKMAPRLTTQFTRCAGVATLALAGAVGVSLSIQAEAAARAQVGAANEVVAADVAAAIPGEDWARVWDTLPERGDVDAWHAHGDEVAAVQARLVTAAARHSRVRVRALHPAHDGDGTPGNGDNGWEIGLSSSTTPHWRLPMPAGGFLSEAWSDGLAHTVAESEQGPLLRTFARLDDAHGRPVLLVEVAAPMTQALWVSRGHAVAVFGVMVGLLAIALSIARRAVLAADADIAGVRSQIAGLGGDGVHTPWDEPPLKFAGRVTRDLETARLFASARIQALEEQLATTSMALASAEMVLEPESLDRRTVLAELDLGPCVTLEVPGGRCETVDLVDLGFDHIVVRVSRYTMVDVAPGMPVSVGWAGGDAAQVLILDRRIEREGELEYVFRVQPSRMLPGTPPAVSRLAYARKAVRMSCAGTDVRASVLAGTLGTLPGEVLDLSTAGLCVRVRTDLADLAATGRSATVQLRLSAGGPEYQVGVIIRSVRARPGGCDLGCLIDPSMTVDVGTFRSELAAWEEQRRRAVVAGGGERGEPGCLDRFAAQPRVESGFGGDGVAGWRQDGRGPGAETDSGAHSTRGVRERPRDKLDAVLMASIAKKI